jgi:hypothetical protein
VVGSYQSNYRSRCWLESGETQKMTMMGELLIYDLNWEHRSSTSLIIADYPQPEFVWPALGRLRNYWGTDWLQTLMSVPDDVAGYLTLHKVDPALGWMRSVSSDYYMESIIFPEVFLPLCYIYYNRSRENSIAIGTSLIYGERNTTTIDILEYSYMLHPLGVVVFYKRELCLGVLRWHESHAKIVNRTAQLQHLRSPRTPITRRQRDLASQWELEAQVWLRSV